MVIFSNLTVGMESRFDELRVDILAEHTECNFFSLNLSVQFCGKVKLVQRFGVTNRGKGLCNKGRYLDKIWATKGL